MSRRSWEFVATDEPTAIAKPFLDAIVMQDSESYRGFTDPPCTDESEVFEVYGKANDFLDQPIASETGPRWRRWRFSQGSTIPNLKPRTGNVQNH